MAIEVVNRVEKQKFIPVDQWVPREDEKVFHERKGVIIAPIHTFYGLSEENPINYFIMTPKKCYNGVTKVKPDGTVSICFREHCCNYLNYFERFYDTAHRLLGIYAHIKFLIDAYPDKYTAASFKSDLYKYIINYKTSPFIHYDVAQMVKDNYIKMTSLYRNTKNPCLEYKDIHSMAFFEASLLQCIIIPMVSHFMYIHKISNAEIKNFLMECYDPIYTMLYYKYGINLNNKLYETIITNISKNKTRNGTLWQMQAIRGINPTIHAYDTMQNIITQIVPKYCFGKNNISFNTNAIKNELTYKITGIPYEYDLIPVSSSERDDDNNSQTDRFEAHMTKQNEALATQLRINCADVMNKIEQLYGPFNEDEINFYIDQLTKGGRHVKNSFQSQLINYLFMAEMGDTNSIKFVNIHQYIILMLAAKRKLRMNNLFLLAEIIGGRVEKMVARKSVNKAILLRMKMSEKYNMVLNQYNFENVIEDTLFGFIAKSIASEFSYISFHNREINGKTIEVNKDVISEEFLSYALMI